MRVLVDYRPALRGRTGVGEYVHELVRALSAPAGPVSRANARLAAFTASWKDRPGPDLTMLQGVEVVDRRVPVAVLTRAWNQLSWPPVEWLAGRSDVVHAATPIAIPGRAPTVLTIHDLHFLRHPERMTAEMRRDYPRRVARDAAAAPAIVVSSQYAARDVHDTLGVPDARIHCCPPGAPAWADEVRRQRCTTPPAHFLFLGTLDPRKNAGVLLDAYARVRSRGDAPPLVLAGGVPPSASSLVERAGRADLRSHVTITGYVTADERLRLMTAAHALILPSLDEGFGLPVLEAMACGVPVVVSSGGSLPEVAGDAATPIDPADVDGFAAAMTRLLDPREAAAAAARGLARAADFDWRHTADRVWRAYMAAHEARA
ncbi:MAG: glycosyltransferase family 4 protein [Acidobacteria bacterium]|nr:glycosyltransferase family 4 protein [Acidobacteriota bacterium]